jgi:hypothetical protein
MSELDIRTSLFNWQGEARTAAELPADVRKVVLEQYKLYLELTDRLSQRRQTVSSFFVTVNTAVVAILGYVNAEKEPLVAGRSYLLVSTAGVILCVLWWRIIKSYRNLNTARFAVIREIETLLPLRPYTAEWDYVGRGQSERFYRPVTHVEAYVPWLFLALFVVVFAWNLPWRLIFGG